jgi:hypothetical protein
VKRGYVLPSVPPNGLHAKQYVTVIVRLLLGLGGELVNGEVAGVDGCPGKRFVDWDDLVPTIQAWLAAGGYQHRQADRPDG